MPKKKQPKQKQPYSYRGPVSKSTDEQLAEEASLNRDFVMARAAAAIAELDAAKSSLIEMLGFFVSPDEDPKNKGRAELYDNALEHASCAVRALESVEVLDGYDPEEAEPWDDEAEEDDDEDEDGEDDDEGDDDE